MCDFFCIYLIWKRFSCQTRAAKRAGFVSPWQNRPQWLATSPSFANFLHVFLYLFLIFMFIQGRCCQSLAKLALLGVVEGPNLPASGKIHHPRGGIFCQSLAKSPCSSGPILPVAGKSGSYFHIYFLLFYLFLICSLFFMFLLSADFASHWQN